MSGLRREATFEGFVVGSNQEAFDAAIAAVDHPGWFNPLTLFGPPGVGKKHLLAAIRSRILANRPGVRVIVVPPQELSDAVTQAIRSGDPRGLEMALDVETLLMPMLEISSKSPVARLAIAALFETLVAKKRQVVTTLDRPIMDLAPAGDALVGRLARGTFVEVRQLGREDRLAVLRGWARARPVTIGRETLEVLVDAVRGADFHSLRAAFARLLAAIELEGEPPTVEVARRLFCTATLPPTASDVLLAVGKSFAVDAAHLVGSEPLPELEQPRALASYLLRELAGMSFQDVSRLLAVPVDLALSRVETVMKKREYDPELRGHLAKIVDFQKHGTS